MRHQWPLVNIRCQGCANSIRKQLSRFPNLVNLEIDVDHKWIAFDAPESLLDSIERRLARMGYVREDHSNENSGLTVARSVMSCLVGKLTKD